ncbi:hypothetical protein OKW30_007746 [Paraburkholderia sp. Clong3]
MRMIGRIAETVVHHHRVGHRRENRAEAVLAVQPFVDERDRRADRALAGRLRQQAIDRAQHRIDTTEQAEPARVLMRCALVHAGVHRRAAEQLVDAHLARITR